MRARYSLLAAMVVVAATALGTGAFTAVSADRTTTVDLVGDAPSYLGMTPHSGPNGAYADATGDGLLSLSLSDATPNTGGAGVNGEAQIRTDCVFNVTNQGTQPVAVWITEDSEAVRFHTTTAGHGLIHEEAFAITLAPGRTAEVGFAVDTRGQSGEAQLLESITVHAVAVEADEPIDDGGTGGDSGGDGGDGGDGGTDDGTVKSPTSPGLSVEDWPSSRRDRYNTGSTDATGPRANLAEVWNRTFDTAAYDRMMPTVAGGQVFFGTQEPELVALNATTGDVAWRVTDLGTPLISPTVTGDGVYVVTKEYDGGWQYWLYKLDPATGTVNWQFAIPDADDDGDGEGPTVVDGVVYYGGEDGVVRALDNETGTLLWNASVGIISRSKPAVDTDTVYVTSTTGWGYEDPPLGRVTALNASDGSERWHVNRTQGLESSVVLANGTAFVVNERNRTVALDAATGTSVWETALSGNAWADPAVADGTLYVVTEEALDGSPGTTYALDTADGSVVWSAENGLNTAFGPPTVAGGVVYTYDRRNDNNGLVGRSTVDGTLLFKYPFNFADGSIAVDDDGYLYLGGNYNVDTRVYKLDGDRSPSEAG